MGRITTGIGLFSGVPIASTVDQLVALAARPRDLLVNLNKQRQNEQVALTTLSAKLLSFQFAARSLANKLLYDQRTVTSSQTDLLSVTATGKPPLGTHVFTPLATVQSHQFFSSGMASRTAPLGAGSFSVRFGGFVDHDTPLELLGGGSGTHPGKIRITDRGGASAEIDLRFARTVDDVLEAINGNTTIAVRAEAHGDVLRLVDQTGAAASLFRVQEVGGGTTAASLGFGNIAVDAGQIEGQDVLRLANALDAGQLNDRRGVRLDTLLADLRITFGDGSAPLDIDFADIPSTLGTKATGTTNAAAERSNARVTFTAVTGGAAYSGVTVSLVDNASITAGGETVAYDAVAKTLVFQIDAGLTTAADVVAALNNDAAAGAVFRASLFGASTGNGLVDTSDVAVTGPPPATATLGTAAELNALSFTAVQGGADFDGVKIVFEDNVGVTAGSETVRYDASDPQNKRLIFQIDEGNTSANDIIFALNSDPTAGALFTAASASPSNGTGKIHVTLTATTAGGALIEPVAGSKTDTLGDLLATLNAADPLRLHAEIAADGDRLILTDLTADGGGTFAVSQLNGSRAAEDLGLLAGASAGVITGRRLLGGLKSSLLAGLDGGRGLGALGSIVITDRAGATETIDLSAAETMDDLLAAINDATVGVVARVNNARNGIVIEDTTNQATSNLVIANGDPTATAERLGILVNAAVASVDSGSLRLQVVSENITLASLNGGRGVAKGTLTISDTRGISRQLNLASSSIETVGDVLLAINRLGLSVVARINDAGDGIAIVDTAHGQGTLRVTEGSSTTAADLHLLGPSVLLSDGLSAAIDGSTTLSVQIDESDTLETLLTKLNELGGGVAATIFDDGSAFTPFRFSLSSQQPGKAGELLVDTRDAPVSLFESTRPRDALLLFGSPSANATGIVASSSTNTFQNALAGTTITIHGSANTPVTVSVATSNISLVNAVKSLVDSFNDIRAQLAELTAFDPETNQRGLLLGDTNLLRIEGDLSRLLSGRISGAGSIASLEAVGLGLNSDGELTFDSEKLTSRFAEEPEAITQFFTHADFGVARRLDQLVDQLAGGEQSLLVNRLEAMAKKIADSDERIEFLNARLEATRQQLLGDFNRMELAIGQLQLSLNALSAIVPLSVPSSSNSNR